MFSQKVFLLSLSLFALSTIHAMDIVREAYTKKVASQHALEGPETVKNIYTRLVEKVADEEQPVNVRQESALNAMKVGSVLIAAGHTTIDCNDHRARCYPTLFPTTLETLSVKEKAEEARKTLITLVQAEQI